MPEPATKQRVSPPADLVARLARPHATIDRHTLDALIVSGTIY